MACPTSQISPPAIHNRSPSPIEAASVPLRMAKLRGAPASRIGSVSARCSTTSKPGTEEGWPSISCALPWGSVDQGAAGEGEEREKEGGGGEGDGQAEHD